MDALQMLRDDHRKVKDLFRQFEEADDKATKKGIVDAVLVELEIHTTLEEEIFYPAVRRQGETGDMMDHAEEEHHAAERLMDELSRMTPDNDSYDAKFSVLVDSIKEHIDDEESQMLPKAAEVGMARLERLGEQMAKRKQEIYGQMERRGARHAAASTRTRSAGGTTAVRSRTASGASRTSTKNGTRAKSATTSRNGARTKASTGSNGTRTRASTATKSRMGTTRARAATAAKTRSRIAGRRSGSQSNKS